MGGGGAAAAGITGKITAQIIDSATNKPVEFASVSVSKSGGDKVLNGAVADEKGMVKLDNLKAGEYRVTITFLGYTTKIIDPVKLSPEKPDFKLGKIFFVPNSKVLNSVNIEAEASLIENKIDKLVYNAEKDVTSAGGNAGDVMRKVPMVTVDADGNVALRGSQSVRILINGKPSSMMAGSVADAMKMIPADQIKSVEVITSPSAKYDGEGSAGIINIITKKKDVQGLSGSINLGVGIRQNHNNGSLNIRKGRFGVNSSFGGNGSWPQIATTNYRREDQVNDVQRVFIQNGRTKTYRLGFFGQLGFDWDINSYNNISSSLRVNRFGNAQDGTVNSQLDTLAFNRASKGDFFTVGIDWTTDYRRTFKKKDQELGMSFQLTDNTTTNTTDFTLTSPNGTLMEKSNNKGVNREMTSQVDYTHPFANKMTLETGLKNILRQISSDYTYDVAGMQDPSRSNVFNYSQDVYASYVSLGYMMGKNYTMKVGTRAEYTAIAGNFATGAVPFSNNYLNVLPNLSFSRTFAKFKTLKLNYTQRIQRPSLFYLNPYINTVDPNNISFGNPQLRPELTQQYELGYSSFWKGTMMNTSFFYKHTTDVIESVLSVDSNGRSMTTFKNMSRVNSYGLNLFGSISPISKLTIRGNINMYLDFITSQLNSLKKNQGISYNGNVMVSYTLPKGLSLESFGFFNSPRRTLQGTNPSFAMLNIGMRKELFKKKGSIGLNITNPFRENRDFTSELRGDTFYQINTFSVPFRSIGVSFSWQFGKMEFSQGKKKKGINNDDLKQGSDGQGQ